MLLVRNSLLTLVFIFCFSCQNDEYLTTNNLESESFKLSVPDYFPAYADDPFNPLTKKGIELGRYLFNDKRLSGNNKVSCATCHVTKLAFSDGQKLSRLGITKNELKRTTPTLINMLWVNNGLFWDGGATNLESQALGPITNPDEMGQDLDILIKELNENNVYIKKFDSAFNNTGITKSNILKALAQYQRSLVSANSKYDKIKKNEKNIAFSKEEKQGYKLFKKNCASCHTEPLFTDNSFHNNGLDTDFNDNSFQNLYKGRYRVTNNPDDIGKYKTPTLRNIMKSAPYMHDGRYNTIEEVLNHYCCNVKNSKTLDSELKKNNTTGLNLSEKDKQHIISFLKTLDDVVFLNQH